MSLVAEVVDAVVGGDTHRDVHALEMTAPTGATIATLEVDNDDSGYAQVLAWIAEHSPGPKVILGLEGTGTDAPVGQGVTYRCISPVNGAQ